MAQILYKLQLFLETIDGLRDKVLFVFIKPYWPRKISPNQLTIFRIIIGIVLFILLFYYKKSNSTLIISLFCIGAATDLLDGSVARALKKETTLGAMLDSTADRILIIPIAIYSLFNSHRWLFFFLLLMEIINALVSVFAQGKSIFIESNIFGKIKMVLQSVVFAVLLIVWPKTPGVFFIYLLWLSIAFIVASIYVKTIAIRKLIARARTQ